MGISTFTTYRTLSYLKKFGILKKLNFTVSRNINKTNINIPILRSNGMTHLVDDESWLNILLNKLISVKSGGFVDVGINIGQTLLKIKSLQPAIKYYGFEPNAVCNYYVLKLLESNSFSDVQIFPFGLSDEYKVLKLYASSDDASSASLIKDFRKGYEEIKIEYNVPVMPGDTVFHEAFISNISIIKIDVEGFEAEVIKGLSATISSQKPLIICEVLPLYSMETELGKARKGRHDLLLKTLTELSYNIFRINEKNAQLESLKTIDIHDELDKSNYVFCHHDDVADLVKVFSLKG